ncbi:MAG: TlpA family protein disulfide reductase [Sandaracinaceae bacterium]|jgi:peroxiredoxin|nr:TlpA family protein disulfide reductase [Sandaracinaceae bacterium]
MKSSELIATLIALCVGAPLVFIFARAAADSEVRRREAPARAMLGDGPFDMLASGATPEQGYFGNDRRAPDFTLNDQRGLPWRLSQHRGKVVVMNFWSVTCGPCVEEMPTFEQLAMVLRRRSDIELVTVSVDAGWAAVSSVMPPNSRLKVLFDPERAIVRGKFGTRLYPETWIIDGEGIIRARIDGARDWSNPIALELIESFL